MSKVDEKLYEIFENHLYKGCLEAESEDLFVAKVVDEYLRYFRCKKMFLPNQFVDEIREETADIVYELVQLKTYGFYSLEEFRKSLINRQT